MKHLYLLLLAIGLLIGTAATVKADVPSKPDTATHTTSVKIHRISDGLWNYSESALCAAAHIAIPGLTFIARKWEQAAPGVYWLRFWAKETSTGKYANVYFHLEVVGDWYEMPNWGWPAPRCMGDCVDVDDDSAPYEPGVCENKSTTAMVNCGCTGGSDPTHCWFLQYPTSTVAAMVEALEQMPSQEQ